MRDDTVTVVHIQLVNVGPDMVVAPGMPGQWSPPKPTVPESLFSEVLVLPGLPPRLLNLRSSEVVVGYRPPKPAALIAADFKSREEAEAVSPAPPYKAVLQITKPVPMLAVAANATQTHTSRSLTVKPGGRRPGFIAPASSNPRPPSARDLRKGQKPFLPKPIRIGLGLCALVALVLFILITGLAIVDNDWIETAKVKVDMEFLGFS